MRFRCQKEGWHATAYAGLPPRNRLFRGAPRTELVSGEGLSRIEVDLPQFEQVPVIPIGASDVKDCFHRVLLPEHSGLRKYLSLQLFLPGILALLRLEASLPDLIPKFPASRSLPMGWKW